MLLPQHPEVCSWSSPEPSLASSTPTKILTPGYPGSKYERNLPAPIVDRELPPSPAVASLKLTLAAAPPPLKY